MKRSCWALIAILVAPLLMGAAPSRLSHHVRYVQRSLDQVMQAKPNAEVAFPSAFRGAVSNLPEPGIPMEPGIEPVISLIVVHSDGAAGLRASGLSLSTVTERTAIVRVPHSRLGELETIPGVFRAELSLPTKLLLETSISETGASQVHGADAPPYPKGSRTGLGVVVGLVDSGIDLSHADFENDTDNTTRITHLWDQNDPGGLTGPPPEYPCNSGRSYCGAEWNKASIDAGQARQTDTVGHGTHVASCAVGDGSATGNGRPAYQYVGVAPEADIMMVNTFFTNDAIIEGVEYMFDRAGKKAAVVNLSLGSQFGPHDGTSALDLALTDLAGPGRIIVAASGNEGDLAIHAEAVIPAGETRTFPLVIGPHTAQVGANNDFTWCEAWFDGNVSFSAESPNGQGLGPLGPGQDGQQNTSQGSIIIDNTITNTVTGDREACIIFTDAIQNQVPVAGTWNIMATNNSATPVEVDIWMGLSTLRTGSGGLADVQFSGETVSFSEMISSPASAEKVIAVGAYVTKRNWTASDNNTYGYSDSSIQPGVLAPFSSQGPLRNDVMKPEIVAPGIGISAALSDDIPGGVPANVRMRDGVHVLNQGTSQAAPHVAGTVALILQDNPNYDYDAIVNVFSNTARSDVNTGTVPNNAFGYGKLDVFAAVGHAVPVKLLNLSAQWESDRAVIGWELSETESGTVFRVERASEERGSFAAVSDPLVGGTQFRWTDPAPKPAEPWYRVRVSQRDGTTGFFGPVRLDGVANLVRLWQNAPNPFQAQTVVAFEMDQPGRAVVEILDIQGRLIKTLLDQDVSAGRTEISWDGVSDFGQPSAAGVYFYRLITQGTIQVKRLILAE